MLVLVGTAGTGLMARMCIAMLVRGVIVRCGDEALHIVRKPRRGAAERKRHARGGHAKQVQQGDKPPRSDPIPSGQSNEHRM